MHKNTTSAIIAALMLTGCATSRPWETARINCLQKANRAAIVAIEHGYEAGVIHNFRNGQAHAVTWIDVDGRRVYWDAEFSEYLTEPEVGEVLLVVNGPSRGALEMHYQNRDRYGTQLLPDMPQGNHDRIGAHLPRMRGEE